MQRRTIYTHPTSGTASPYWNEKSSKLINILNTEWFYSPENETHTHTCLHRSFHYIVPTQHIRMLSKRLYRFSHYCKCPIFTLTLILCAMLCTVLQVAGWHWKGLVPYPSECFIFCTLKKILIRLLMFSNVMTASLFTQCRWVAPGAILWT